MKLYKKKLDSETEDLKKAKNLIAKPRLYFRKIYILKEH